MKYTSVLPFGLHQRKIYLASNKVIWVLIMYFRMYHKFFPRVTKIQNYVTCPVHVTKEVLNTGMFTALYYTSFCYCVIQPVHIFISFVVEPNSCWIVGANIDIDYRVYIHRQRDYIPNNQICLNKYPQCTANLSVHTVYPTFYSCIPQCNVVAYILTALVTDS